MAPNPRVKNAFMAMKELGISEEAVKPVLKRLLKVYDKNWELIEDDNYSVLIDGIFEEEEDAKLARQKKKCNIDEDDLEEEAQMNDALDRPLKRLRKKSQESGESTSPCSSNLRLAGFSLKIPKVEDGLPESYSGQQLQDVTESPQTNDGKTRAGAQLSWQLSRKGKQPVSSEFVALPNGSDPSQPNASAGTHAGATKTYASDSPSSHICLRDRQKEALSPQLVPREKISTVGTASTAVDFKDPNDNPGIILLPKPKVPETFTLLNPKDAPFTDDFPQYIPIQVIHPGKPGGQDPPVSQFVDKEGESNGVLASSSERTNCEIVTATEGAPSTLDITSTPDGVVRISLSLHSALGGPDFQTQGSDFLERINVKNLQPYRIINPRFMLPKPLTDMCQGLEDIVSKSTDNTQEGLIDATPALEFIQKSTTQNDTGICLSSSSNGSINMQCSAEVVVPEVPRIPSSLNGLHDHIQADKRIVANGCSESDKGKELEDPEFTNSLNLVVVPQCQLSNEDLRSIHDLNDLTMGEERVQISWVNEITSELPPSFHYIPENLVFQNALVNVSLSAIGNENCCSACFGNCLSSPITCACARKMGGAFAYTLEGLVREEFLEECISLSPISQKCRLFYCQECPVQRMKKDDIVEQCKGHLERKFIKECWSKCGCYKECGNRVVQRGISRRLQVFLTSERKGWGLRTLEDLPRGAFVCEYVGEILTSMELHTRSTNSEKLIYPVVLDAGWGLGVVKDEEALCLDAASYGNVARFINHRCLDANLVEIPVEVESPDHHYYHLALFTTRKVDALEELTWDYGIGFDDQDHAVEAFQCQCGSKYCRVMKRSNRSRSASIER